MSFKLHAHGSTGKRLRKLLVGELDKALAALPGGDGDEAVHFVRRCGKRSLAVLRLLRPALPASARARVRRAWRAAMHALAPGRDAAALASAAKRLAARFLRQLRSAFIPRRHEFDRAAVAALAEGPRPATGDHRPPA